MREDLATTGQPPSEDDFYYIILGSLVFSYNHYISAIRRAWCHDELMRAITDEFNRHALSSVGAKREKNDAFYSNYS